MNTLIELATTAPAAVATNVQANSLLGGVNQGAQELQTTIGIVVGVAATIIFLVVASKKSWGIGAIIGGLFVGAVIVVGSALGGVELLGQVIKTQLDSWFA